VYRFVERRSRTSNGDDAQLAATCAASYGNIDAKSLHRPSRARQSCAICELTPMPPDKNSELKSPPKPTDYEVGYGKPPKASRFAPGQSGNRRGRPKGARNKALGPKEERLAEIILGEAYRPVKMNDGKKRVTMPVIEAMVWPTRHGPELGDLGSKARR
jgi:hypothetical protein